MMSEGEFLTGLKKLMDRKEDGGGGGGGSAGLKWLSLQNVWCQKTKYTQKSSSASAYTSSPSTCEGKPWPPAASHCFYRHQSPLLLSWCKVYEHGGRFRTKQMRNQSSPSRLPWSMRAVSPASRVRHSSVDHNKPPRSLMFRSQKKKKKGSRGFSLHVCCALRPWWHR